MSTNNEPVPSLQEMFNRAWLGLQAQGWRMSGAVVDLLDDGPTFMCEYEDPTTGYRCAWGHVDPSLTTSDQGPVQQLHHYKIGIAGRLDPASLRFATELQLAHDGCTNNSNEAPEVIAARMQDKMRHVAELYRLDVPGDVAC